MPISQKRGVFLVLFPLEDIIQVRIICFFHGGSILLRKSSWASYLPSAKIYNFWCSFSHGYGTIWVFIPSRVIRAHCGSVLDSFPRHSRPHSLHFQTLLVSSPPSHTLHPGHAELHRIVHVCPSLTQHGHTNAHPCRSVTRSWKWALPAPPGTPSTARLH